ncbi:MED6-domain-containing protein [Calocera cornea HHB12733]|uniref:Mediator of RNA polymerase II transcription subunit 6 n=1 Tax=Calocera cornea HHB12733 TaxID=1353952 RepID=A0A165J2H1_9BASI|nr:MED6-domain-containing protein [Calocera cornea HHB12733]
MSTPNEDDLSTTSWLFAEWIAAFGPLTHAQKALDYFSLSIFWDKQSTNQVLRMQTQHTLGPDGMSTIDEESELRKFTGVEFAVVHGRPPGLWIIQKRERLSPDEVRPLASYFILNATIYPSPSLYSVLSTSLSTSLHYLRSSLETLREHKPAYNPRVGTSWPVAPPRDPSRQLARSRAGSLVPEEGEAPSRDARAAAAGDKKEHEVLPMWNAFMTASSYATAAAAARDSALVTPDEEIDEPLAADEPGSAVRERGMTRERESATPAPTGGKRHATGGKAKRRRKSRVATVGPS